MKIWLMVSILADYRIYSSITRTFDFLIENWYIYPNKNVTNENTELKQAMLKLNTTFMLQHFVLLHHRA